MHKIKIPSKRNVEVFKTDALHKCVILEFHLKTLGSFFSVHVFKTKHYAAMTLQLVSQCDETYISYVKISKKFG